jgi:hypothetical protein
MLRPEYLAQRLTPYPLPTKDWGVLRTIGDAHAYIMALPKKRGLRARPQSTMTNANVEQVVTAVDGQTLTLKYALTRSGARKASEMSC